MYFWDSTTKNLVILDSLRLPLVPYVSVDVEVEEKRRVFLTNALVLLLLPGV